MHIHIRPATAGDIDAMVRLQEKLSSSHGGASPDCELLAASLKLLIEDPEERIVLVAERENRIVGMVSGQILVSAREGGLGAQIESLAVAPSCRGKGLGAHLLAGIENWARALGAVRLQLLADRSDAPAESFCRKSGWEKTQLVCLRKTEPGTVMCPGTQERRAS